MMKYAFVLVLLLIGGIGSVYGLALVYRWNHDMIMRWGEEGLTHKLANK